MKKFVALLMALILVLCSAAFAEVQSLPTLGLELDIPASTGETNYMLQEINDGDVIGVSALYINSGVLIPLSEQLQEALTEGDTDKATELQTQFVSEFYRHTSEYYEILGLKSDDLDAQRDNYGITDETATLIGANSTRTYYLVKTEADDILSDEDTALMEATRAEVEAIAASAKVIEISEPTDEDMASDLASFTTVDMNGNTVTQDIFKQAKLTVLNVWGTYCTPCVNEMPDLAAWSNEMPEGVQMVGLIIDVGSASDKNFEKAEKILSKSGSTFTNILYNESLDAFLENITGTPTTLFIDSNGNSVHEMIVGADIDSYKTAVEEILAQ